MAVYTFTLERFHVDTTRSRGEDTDTVAFGAAVADFRPAPQTRFTGDVGSGDVVLNLVSPPLFVSDRGPSLLLSYAIYNGDTANLSVSLDGLVGRVIDEYTNQALEGPSGDPGASLPDDPSIPDNATFDDTSWINVLEFAALGSLLFPNCDGMVAADAIARSKTELDAAIDAAGGTSYRQTRRYPGTDSPAGCGSNSDYTVSWSVTRDRESGPPYSLRNFLRRNHLVPTPGLRSLFPGQPLTVGDLIR